MTTLEDIYSARLPVETDLPVVYRTMKLDNQIVKEKKDLKWCGILGDLGKIGQQFSLINSFGEVVRKIRIEKETVIIDPCCVQIESLTLPKALPVYYEEWFMDRGSYLFLWTYQGTERLLKLATEGDTVSIQ